MQAIAIGLLKNKWFWIILFSIIILLIVRKNWNKIKSKLDRDRGDYGGEGLGDTKEEKEENKEKLQDLANRLYSAIYDVFVMTSTKMDLFSEANTLNDTELKYLSTWYKKSITKGNTLYEDVDNEWIAGSSGNSKTQLLVRLAKLGEK